MARCDLCVRTQNPDCLRENRFRAAENRVRDDENPFRDRKNRLRDVEDRSRVRENPVSVLQNRLRRPVKSIESVEKSISEVTESIPSFEKAASSRRKSDCNPSKSTFKKQIGSRTRNAEIHRLTFSALHPAPRTSPLTASPKIIPFGSRSGATRASKNSSPRRHRSNVKD